ncbi:CZB domain-containing protein [Ideonella livida]|uniref:Chemoreceptor zinc-binding domain-containing protein n=1 Tax=Ideonella livida TaxID=2707176 RepID=A0A7C9THN9_9BURK|nr:CZB domain-containing protein [Ideonella livida]NDY89824.1 hypothetical protein [Ideonella livida]
MRLLPLRPATSGAPERPSRALRASVLTRSLENGRQAHRLWHEALVNQLLGRASPEAMRAEEACFDDRCPCGDWVHGEGLRRFGRLPGFKELVRQHQMVHLQASNVLSFQHSGASARARALFKTGYADASRRLMAALDHLEQQCLTRLHGPLREDHEA